MKFLFQSRPLSFHLVCFLVSALLAGFGILRPYINWDIIGYVAAAYSNQELSPEDLHTKTFADVRASATEDQYKDLTEQGDYRSTVAKDAASLSQHLPFYTIRVLYVAAIRGLAQTLAIPYSAVTYILSAICGALCALSLALFYKNKNLAYALSLPLLIVFSGLKDASALSTPDTLATLVALVAVYLYLRNNPYLVLLSFLIPLIRTDYIILCGLFSLCYFKRKEFLRGLLVIAPALIAYVLVNRLHHNYGFLKIFTFTLIEISPFPAELKVPTTFLPYAEAYLRGFKETLGHRHFILYLGFFIYWYRNVRAQKSQSANDVVFLTLGFVVLHLLLFPAYYERFFIWPTCLAAITLISWTTEKYLHKSA